MGEMAPTAPAPPSTPSVEVSTPVSSVETPSPVSAHPEVGNAIAPQDTGVFAEQAVELTLESSTSTPETSLKALSEGLSKEYAALLTQIPQNAASLREQNSTNMTDTVTQTPQLENLGLSLQDQQHMLGGFGENELNNPQLMQILREKIQTGELQNKTARGIATEVRTTTESAQGENAAATDQDNTIDAEFRELPNDGQAHPEDIQINIDNQTQANTEQNTQNSTNAQEVNSAGGLNQEQAQQREEVFRTSTLRAFAELQMTNKLFHDYMQNMARENPAELKAWLKGYEIWMSQRAQEMMRNGDLRSIDQIMDQLAVPGLAMYAAQHQAENSQQANSIENSQAEDDQATEQTPFIADVTPETSENDSTAEQQSTPHSENQEAQPEQARTYEQLMREAQKIAGEIPKTKFSEVIKHEPMTAEERADYKLYSDILAKKLYEVQKSGLKLNDAMTQQVALAALDDFKIIKAVETPEALVSDIKKSLAETQIEINQLPPDQVQAMREIVPNIIEYMATNDKKLWAKILELLAAIGLALVGDGVGELEKIGA